MFERFLKLTGLSNSTHQKSAAARHNPLHLDLLNSLLVGAIVVGNIMLVSVTERTREIGTLRSIGATKFDIRLQFITEALTICLIGGILGILIGIIISLNLGGISFQDELGDETNLPAVITPISVIIAFLVSLLVGLISGAYPAYRASELDPIEALRSE